jgi:hypothetical protein
MQPGEARVSHRVSRRPVQSGPSESHGAICGAWITAWKVDKRGREAGALVVEERVDILQSSFRRSDTPGSCGVECIELGTGVDIGLCHHSRETSSFLTDAMA